VAIGWSFTSFGQALKCTKVIREFPHFSFFCFAGLDWLLFNDDWVQQEFGVWFSEKKRRELFWYTRRMKEQSEQYRWVLGQSKTGGLWQGELSSSSFSFYNETAFFDMMENRAPTKMCRVSEEECVQMG